ncbi:YchJ family protein [Shewanella sp. MF05960]|uniref:YchJ family protein n=1 Tax=Shewanella sp. MF05960 TaxID=3434874 RepID=UPI003D79DEAE
MAINITATDLCPCGSQTSYQQCCLPFHSAEKVAQSPQQLMRSRYCAFVVGQFDYLISTHHPDYRQGLTVDQLAQSNTHWLGLQVLATKQLDRIGEVTFKAWYIEDKHIDAIYENSSFVLCEGQWLYTEGKQMTTRAPERNEPCICHSGRKFKQCCAKLTH